MLEPAGGGNTPPHSSWLHKASGTGLLASIFFLFTGVAALAAGPSDLGLAIILSAAVLVSALIVLTVIDIQTHRLPDVVTLPLVGLGLIATWLLDEQLLLAHILGAAIAYLVLAAIAVCYRYLRGEVGLGGGDIKLFAAGGAWVGPQGLPSVLLIATGIALIAALVGHFMGHETTARSRIAFGPFLAAGIWLVWLFQKAVG